MNDVSSLKSFEVMEKNRTLQMETQRCLLQFDGNIIEVGKKRELDFEISVSTLLQVISQLIIFVNSIQDVTLNF